MLETAAPGAANRIGDEEVKVGRSCFVRLGVDGGAVVGAGGGRGGAGIAGGGMVVKLLLSSKGTSSGYTSSCWIGAIGAGMVGALGGRNDIGWVSAGS